MNFLRYTKRPLGWLFGVFLAALMPLQAGVVFQGDSAYHHIQVIDNNGVRTLSFNGSQETRMSLRNPLQGHFIYTEFFHVPWIWNNNIKNVLMMGLGGGSTQRAYQHYYPQVNIDTVELDPVVIAVAGKYFGVKPTDKHKIIRSDGRMHLRRTRKKYDVILMDAYTANRYGSFIPYSLATKEFFQLAHGRLTDNGVVAYNVIGTTHGWRADILGSIYRTMNSVFPKVYLFPAPDSKNVVLIATKSPQTYTITAARQRASQLINSKRVQLRFFATRVNAMRIGAPPTAARSPVLTDNYAPVDGLLKRAR